MKERISGILAALITPFDENGNIKLELAPELVKLYQDQGAAGLYMTGFTGEGAFMDVGQRKAWAEAVLKAAEDKLPVFVHVGYCANPDDAVELAAHASRHGAFAVSSVGISSESDLDENVAYFKRISEASNLPFYIYWNSFAGNLNGGRRIEPEDLLDAMQAVPTFRGLKYTDSNLYFVDRMRRHQPDINILTGVDAMCLSGSLMGSDGAIGALQAITTGHMRVMWEKFHAGDITGAKELQTRNNNIYQSIDSPKRQMIPAIKAVLEGYYGIPAGYPCAASPFSRMTDDAEIKKLLAEFEANILK